jgi:hypothetical protein
VRLSEGIESPRSAYAEEGTKAHELAALWLETGVVPECDEETLNAIQVYVETVMNDFSGVGEILVEHSFNLDQIHPGAYGTADAVVYEPVLKLLRVYDYKHGQGILVEAENNSQLKYYGLGALLSSGYPCENIELVIVQPRATHVDGPVRRWRFAAFDLVEFAADLADFAAKTSEPNAPLVSGDHCRFCPASAICPELSKKALAVAQTEFSPAFSYSPEKLSETLAKLDMLEGYAKSVRAFAYAEAEHGRCPPGWKLVDKRATRKWRDENEASKIFRTFLGMDAVEMSVKSPAQIEKLLPKDQKKFVAEHSVYVSSGLTLVPDSDKRPPALSSPERDFIKIENDKPQKGENE